MRNLNISSFMTGVTFAQQVLCENKPEWRTWEERMLNVAGVLRIIIMFLTTSCRLGSYARGCLKTRNFVQFLMWGEYFVWRLG